MRGLVVAALLFATPAHAETAAEYFSKDRGIEHVSARTPKASRQNPSSDRAKEVIAYEVTKTLGRQWVPIALEQARRESNFKASAVGIKLGKRHGHQRAVGVFQVLPSTARGLGFNPALLNNLEYGTKVGVAYMGKCIEAGVKTSSQMNHCFLYGFYKWRAANAKPGRTNKRNTRSS
jgi:hypothetical protein